MKKKEVAIKYGWRSGFEQDIAEQLKRAGVEFEYEPGKLVFTQPAKQRSYTPDFVLTKKNGDPMVLESKGRWLTADRQKHLMVRDCHPDLDIRFVFTNAKARISKASKTTYAMWCDKQGFKWAHKVVPEEWLDECK